MTDRSINVLLIGAAGSGRSSTGNTILGHSGFTLNRNTSHKVTTPTPLKRSCTYPHENISVIDDINIGGVHSGKKEDETTLMKALSVSQKEFHALVIVLKFDIGFSDDEARALDVVRAVLGEDVIKKYGICVITHEDNFSKAVQDGEIKDFSDWCKQIPELQNLYDECEERYVLLNNTAKSVDEKQRQREQLIQRILELSENGWKRYVFKKEGDLEEKVEPYHGAALSDSSSGGRVFGGKEMNREMTSSPEIADPQKEISEADDKLNQMSSRMAKDKLDREQLQDFLEDLTQLKVRISNAVDERSAQWVMIRIAKLANDIKSRLKAFAGTTSSKPGSLETGKQAAEDSLPTNMSAVSVVNKSKEKCSDIADSKLGSVSPEENSVIDLLLIGRVGNGRSSTGNSLIGERVFKSSTSASKEIKSNICNAHGEIDQKLINVIDGPGIDDVNSPADVEKLIEAINESLNLCRSGFSAILIVLKFGQRLTRHELEALKTIKSLLGENVIQEFGICIITHGDNFDPEEYDKPMSFESWCKEDSGDARSVYEECGFRCVLFDNRTKDEVKKAAQRKELMDLVDVRKRYSKSEFEKAEDGKKKLILKTRLPEMKKQVDSLVDEVKKKLTKIEQEAPADPVNEMKEMVSVLQSKKTELTNIQPKSASIEEHVHRLAVFEAEIQTKVRLLESEHGTPTVPPSTAKPSKGHAATASSKASRGKRPEKK